IKLEPVSRVTGMTNAHGLTQRVERETIHQAQVSALRSGTSKGGAQRTVPMNTPLPKEPHV
ncbi:hypothetical protein RA265_29025, partial [Pseudomonas syringae pv. tagetis]|uniref:hypothetical protein n=1 Tax=Pseudomonas syringae group genomosp. 7 TaxID=251699 RepID=UPI00376FAFAC